MYFISGKNKHNPLINIQSTRIKIKEDQNQRGSNIKNKITVRNEKSQLNSQQDIKIRVIYLSNGSRRVYNQLLGYCGIFDSVQIAVETIARNTQLSKRSVQRCLNQLKTVGLLHIEYRDERQTSIYTIPAIVLKHARKLIKYFSYCASLPYRIIKKAYDNIKLQNAFKKSQQKRGKKKNVTLYNVFSYIYNNKHIKKEEHTKKDVIKSNPSTCTNLIKESISLLSQLTTKLSSHPILDMLKTEQAVQQKGKDSYVPNHDLYHSRESHPISASEN